MQCADVSGSYGSIVACRAAGSRLSLSGRPWLGRFFPGGVVRLLLRLLRIGFCLSTSRFLPTLVFEVGRVPARAFQAEGARRDQFTQHRVAALRALCGRWITYLLEHLQLVTTVFTLVLVYWHDCLRTIRKGSSPILYNVSTCQAILGFCHGGYFCERQAVC